MASGLEAFNALKRATAHLTAGSEFSVNTDDSYDLAKLKVSDLVSQGYDEGVAEEVSSALLKRDFGHEKGTSLIYGFWPWSARTTHVSFGRSCGSRHD